MCALVTVVQTCALPILALVEDPVAAQMRQQHHRFEKPGGMREMPFGRARIGHRLHRGIGIRQRFGKFQARVANVSVMSAKVFGFGDETARGGSIHATPLYWRSEEHTSDLQSLMRL